MFARRAGAGLLLGIAFATQATAKVSEAELAQISLNAISLCVHAALYQHDGLDAAALYHAALTVEHPVGATPADCGPRRASRASSPRSPGRGTT